MKKQPKFILIDVEIYKMSVIVTWETTVNEIEEYFYKLIKKKPDNFNKLFSENIENANGLCMNIFDKDKFIWLKKRPTKSTEYGVLYHEIHHAVYFIAKEHGFDDSTEAEAYLYEYIVTACNKVLWK